LSKPPAISGEAQWIEDVLKWNKVMKKQWWEVEYLTWPRI
jgi:hypothetical protein